MNELTDPETLREREDAEFIDTPTEEHQNHFEVYGPIAGMAIAGVTDTEGQLLLLEREDAPHPIVPHGQVTHTDEWATIAREAVADSAGITVSVADVLRVRHNTYRSETGEETTGHDVVFAASPTTHETDPETDHAWTAVWRDPATLDLPDDGDNDVLNDIRLVV